MSRELRKRLLPLLLFLFSSVLTSSAALGQRGGLRGRVIDRETKTPLAGVEIRLLPGPARSRTSADGVYALEGIAPGLYTLEASLAGYAKESRKDILVKAGETPVVDLEMAPETARLQEYVSVVGSSLPAKSTSGAIPARITGDEIRTMPGGVEDIGRALKTTLGVSQVGDVSNELLVRGGSPWENGFTLGNIPIPDINHFQNQGNSGGIVGMIEASRIEDIDFFVGGFSVAYGNRMSSIAEIRLKEAARDRLHTRLNLNTAGFGGSVEGPLFNGNGSMSLSLRRSYHDIVARWIGFGVAPRFADGIFTLTADLDPRNRIEVLALAGQSRMDIDMEEALREGFNNAVNYRTAQGTFGLNWRRLRAAGVSETSLSYSAFSNVYSLDSVTNASEYYIADTARRSLTLRNVNSWQVSERGRLLAGLDLAGEREIFDNYFAPHISRLEVPIPETQAAGDHSEVRAGAFVEYTARVLERLAVTLGLRADYRSWNRKASLSPRVSTTLSLSDRWSIHASFGRYTQSLPLYLVAYLADSEKLAEPSALHAALGFRCRLSDRFHLDVEAYAKEYRGMPMAPEDPAVFVMDGSVNFNFYQTYVTLVDTGKGSVRGLDIILRSEGRTWGGVAGLTLMRSRFLDLRGVWRDRQNDNRFLATIIGSFKPNDNWSFSARFQAAGGVPYTPADMERSRALQILIIDSTRINAERYPAYAAVHLRVDRSWSWKRSRLLVYLSLMNALNRKNTLAYLWSKTKNDIVTVYQAPILPEFGIEWIF